MSLERVPKVLRGVPKALEGGPKGTKRDTKDTGRGPKGTRRDPTYLVKPYAYSCLAKAVTLHFKHFTQLLTSN